MDEPYLPPWCPECEPTLDPFETLVEIEYCYRHRPSREGSEDARLPAEAPVLGTGEITDGLANKQACDFIHRII